MAHAMPADTHRSTEWEVEVKVVAKDDIKEPPLAFVCAPCSVTLVAADGLAGCCMQYALRAHISCHH